MRRSLRIRSAVVTLVVAATLLGPFAADSVGDGSSGAELADALTTAPPATVTSLTVFLRSMKQ